MWITHGPLSHGPRDYLALGFFSFLEKRKKPKGKVITRQIFTLTQELLAFFVNSPIAVGLCSFLRG
jgi:hypothetical protein